VRLAVAIGALALGASSLTVTVLPRPAFPGPAPAPKGPHRLVLVSSRYLAHGNLENDVITAPADRFRGLPGQQILFTANRIFGIYGRDGATGRYLVAATKAASKLYAFDFKNYAWPPRIKSGEREFVYEQPVWALEVRGTLYVENAHSTYASSSYNRNGYVTAIDLTTKRAVWRSPALVANASTFLATKHYLVTGYGFTKEPDFLYLLDRGTGKVIDRLPLPSAPESITRHQGLIRVRTYDHVVTVRLKGA
jgi:hypothetical protein